VRYLVYASYSGQGEDTSVHTMGCSKTKPLDRAWADLDALGPAAGSLIFEKFWSGSLLPRCVFWILPLTLFWFPRSRNAYPTMSSPRVRHSPSAMSLGRSRLP
jgi:hypothetical protein